MKSRKSRAGVDKVVIGWDWDGDKWMPIYEDFTPKGRKKKVKSLLKEIDDMVDLARDKSNTGNYTYTIACNQLPDKRPGTVVYILKDKMKLKPGKDKSKKPCKIDFSHYMDDKNYVATMMRADFESMFNKTVKAGRYRHMTCDFEFGKNKKPKLLKKSK